MNGELSEMSHCLNGPGNCTDMTVLERRRAHVRWQQSYFGVSDFGGAFLEPSQENQVGNFQGLVVGGSGCSVLDDVVTHSVKPDPGLKNGWLELGRLELPNMGFGSGGSMNGSPKGLEMNSSISRTSICPPTEAQSAPEAKGKVSVPAEKMSSAAGRDSFKKRKADKMQNTKVRVRGSVFVFVFVLSSGFLHCFHHKKLGKNDSLSFQCVFSQVLINCLL